MGRPRKSVFPRKRVMISIDPSVVEACKQYRLNLSDWAEKGVKAGIRIHEQAQDKEKSQLDVFYEKFPFLKPKGDTK